MERFFLEKRKKFIKKRYKQKLQAGQFFTLFRSPVSAVIRLKSKLSFYKNCNLFNSLSQYSQTSRPLSSCFGFFQLRTKVYRKVYQIRILKTKKKKYIYANRKTVINKKTSKKNTRYIKK